MALSSNMKVFTNSAVLAALIFGFFARADERGANVVDLAKLREAKKNASSTAPQACVETLANATLYTFGRSYESRTSRDVVQELPGVDRGTLDHSYSKFDTPIGNGTTYSFDVNDESTSVEIVLAALQNSHLQKDLAARAAIRLYAVHRFLVRMHKLRFGRQPFVIGEGEPYAHMISAAMPNLFANNANPETTIRDLSVNFLVLDPKFPDEDRYLFLTAIMLTLNLKEAMEVSKAKFADVIVTWHNFFKNPRAPRLKATEAEETILAKIGEVVRHYPELQEALFPPEH